MDRQPGIAGAGMTPWLALLLAGLMEIAWALGLKYSDGCTRLWPSLGTVAALALSFVFLGLSLRSVPFGTAYAVWTGIGAAGAAMVGMVFLGDAVSATKLVSIGLILSGVIGLNLSGVTP